MKWKEIARDYFTFTRSERIGTMAILVLIIVIFLLPLFFRNPGQPLLHPVESPLVRSAAPHLTDSLTDQEPHDLLTYQSDPVARSNDKSSHPAFYFDPNTLPADDWLRLGLKPKTVQTLIKYRDKGGRFRSASDLAKIYGLPRADYERIFPFVRIAGPATQANGPIDKTPEKTRIWPQPTAAIDINEADTTALITLPGIGSRLATRIIAFRDKLGGFFSVDQVAETFGLPDSTFQKIRGRLVVTGGTRKTININSATVEELKRHPYLKQGIAIPLVAYRTEHGPYPNVESIRKLAVITEDLYERISPYLSVQ